MTKAGIITVLTAAAVAVGIAPASATTITGGPNFTATSTNFVLTSGSSTTSCTSTNIAGKFTTTGGTPSFQAGEIQSATWSGCDWIGSPMTVTANALPWALWVTGATNNSGVTPVEIRGINMTWTDPSLGCTIQITGTAPATFTNSNQELTFTGGSLSTPGSGFCPGLGSTGSLSGDYAFDGWALLSPINIAGGSVSGGPSYTSTSSNSVLTSGSSTISCSSSTATGNVTDGTGTPSFQAGVVDTIAWSSCTALGAPATVTANSGSLPWALWVTGATSASGVTPGEIRGVNATVSVPSLGCTIQVTGTAPATFTNSSQDLQFTGGSLSTVGSGFCPGLGTTGSMSGDYTVTGPVTSSPLTLS